MELKEWMRIYRKIEQEFSFPREREVKAREYLSHMLGNRVVSMDRLSSIISGDVYVVGYAPSLEREIPLLTHNYPIIAADDSAIILKDSGITPKIVLTDLDGDVKELEKINTIFGIHAHGDNIHQLHFVKDFPLVFGTTQIEPAWNVYNFGGFTDGDRCVFLASHFGARVHLIGFDFEHPRIKPGKNVTRKIQKLKWANYLISLLQQNGVEIIWENLK